MSKAVTIGILLALGAGATWYFFLRGPDAATGKVTFRSGKVERLEVVEGAAASGTVQPVELVQVGTQVSGVILKLFVDFNSKVTAGQTIALLDPRRLNLQVTQDEASVARSRADVERSQAALLGSRSDLLRVTAQAAQAKADIERAQALLTQALREYERQSSLAEKKLATQTEVDAAVAQKTSLEAQFASAQASARQIEAQISGAEAAIQQAQAQVALSEASVRQSEAQLEGDKVNLGYATITSPVDGVVVSRSVDVGQTVAASLSAPTLFVIARDLTKVHVETSVPEADIGRVRQDQHARFTVDAYPEKTFDGVVSQVRLASTTVQNVVTYTVVVDASNDGGLLFPGMTANVVFEVARGAKDALTVPSTALRLQPAADLVIAPPAAETKAAPTDGAPAAADKPNEKAPGDGPGAAPGGGPGGGQRGNWQGRNGGGGGGGGGGGRTGGRRTRGTVYVVTPENKLRAIAVKTGVSDGVHTVVEPVDPASLTDGTEVVTAILREEEPAATNPFAPPRMGGPTRTGGGGR